MCYKGSRQSDLKKLWQNLYQGFAKAHDILVIAMSVMQEFSLLSLFLFLKTSNNFVTSHSSAYRIAEENGR
jgi:hypothetical protein